MKTELGPTDTTERGFPIINFKDRYDDPCSLQMSSLAEYEKPGTSAVWLGRHDVKPMILASVAKKIGVKTNKTTGWIEYPIPGSVELNARMHLDREQVESLIGHLQSWLENDTF